jgi:hypothetical protein
MVNIQKISTLLLLFVLSMAACTVEPNFDEPPTDIGTSTPAANTTIKALKAKLSNPSVPLEITEDIIIRGTVISSDRAGNFYKQLVVQDASGGIEIETFGTFLYAQFPIGREVAVRCKGLYLFSDNDLIRLSGGAYLESGRYVSVGITDAQIRSNIVKGPIADSLPTPRVVTISQINANPDLLSTLVRVENVQFLASDTSATYAEVLPPSNVNRTIVDCNNNELILRNSGYSDFANVKLPSGKGSIVAVVSTYREDRQLLIRDVQDITMTDTRCNVGGGGGGGGTCTTCLLDQNFEGTTTNQDITLAGWTNASVTGTQKWRSAIFSNNKYAQLNPFNGPDATVQSWLVSPELNATTVRTLTFDNSWAFYRHEGLSVWYSTDFGTAGAANANWVQLTANIAKQADGTGNFGNWVSSGNVALPVTSNGKIWIGFKYVGGNNNSTNTTSWRIDNVKVQ